MKDAAARLARLEARVAPKQKKLIERAAALEGRSVTDFVVASAQAAAARVIEQHTILALSEGDQQVFVSALLDTRVPRGRLAKAAQRFRRRNR
jgi:uncharacterized protein (DUF1778 family)